MGRVVVPLRGGAALHPRSGARLAHGPEAHRCARGLRRRTVAEAAPAEADGWRTVELPVEGWTTPPASCWASAPNWSSSRRTN
jgi:hypothetical protein